MQICYGSYGTYGSYDTYGNIFYGSYGQSIISKLYTADQKTMYSSKEHPR